MHDPQQPFRFGTGYASGTGNPHLKRDRFQTAKSPQLIYRGQVMTKSIFFKTLPNDREWERQRACHLTKIAQLWDAAICQGLQNLAQATWRNCHMFGLVPLRRYRLRHQVTPEAHVWWVEHDVPPYDLYWCAAYRIQLTLNDRDDPVLTVKSETALHQVTPLTVKVLHTILAQTGKELPLLILRKMSTANDP